MHHGFYLIGYAVIRFGIEYLCGDPRAAVGGADKMIFDGENANNRYVFWLDNAKARLEGVTVQAMPLTVCSIKNEESPHDQTRYDAEGQTRRVTDCWRKCGRPRRGGAAEAPWTLENVTIAGNGMTSQTHPVFYSINTKACQLVNTIITANEATAEPVWGDATVVDHSWSSGDPKFIRTTGKKAYHLGMGSPCRDTGTSEGRSWMIGTKDQDGKGRIIGCEVDIGCFEYDPTGLMQLVR